MSATTRGPGPSVAPPGATAAPVALVALVLTAWVGLVAWGRSPAGGYLDHEGLAHPDALRVGMLTAAWALMALAMMLPASLPYVRRLLSGARDDRHGVGGHGVGGHGVGGHGVGGHGVGGHGVAALVVAFLGVWVAFGVLLTAGDLALHETVERSAALAARGWLVLPLTLGAAGAYQLSAVKRRALDRCRTPGASAHAAWHAGGRSVWRLGLRHAADCVGACAGLMVVVFALGMTSLAAMAGGTAVALAERRAGHAVAVVVGIGLVVAALVARTSA